jgi:hypothetical protein
MRLRQVALVAHDLAAAEAAVVAAFDLEVCFRDPTVAHFGLHNALFPIGDKLLEVVSPTEAGTTAGRLLDKRGGDGGYMVLVQTADVEAQRAHLGEVGARIVFEAKGEAILGLHVHPRDVGGAILSIDQADPWESWEWAGPHWERHVRTGVVRDIAAVELQGPDPEAMARRWADVLGRPVGPDGRSVPLEEGELRFVPDRDGRGEGLGAIDVVAADPARVGQVVDVVGTRFRFVA